MPAAGRAMANKDKSKESVGKGRFSPAEVVVVGSLSGWWVDSSTEPGAQATDVYCRAIRPRRLGCRCRGDGAVLKPFFLLHWIDPSSIMAALKVEGIARLTCSRRESEMKQPIGFTILVAAIFTAAGAMP